MFQALHAVFRKRKQMNSCRDGDENRRHRSYVISRRLRKDSFLQVQKFLKLLPCGVHIKPEPVKPVKTSNSDDYYDEKNMEIGRPLTPYISIYATQLQGVMSIQNRVTGAAWTLQIFTFAVASLVLPESVDFYVDKINSWNIDPIIIFLGKCLIAWPMVYHTLDGTRHLLWDFGMILTNRSVVITGWSVIILSVAVTVYLSLLA